MIHKNSYGLHVQLCTVHQLLNINNINVSCKIICLLMCKLKYNIRILFILTVVKPNWIQIRGQISICQSKNQIVRSMLSDMITIN